MLLLRLLTCFSSSPLPFLRSPPLTSPLSRMLWRLRRRSRTICLSLAFLTVFLHLLLALASLSMYPPPCDSPPSPSILRALARSSYAPTGITGLADPPADATQRDSSDVDASEDGEGRVGTPPASVEVAGSRGHHDNNRAEPLESGTSKLEALFDHPLYNTPGPAVPEDDWLLRVKPKVKAAQESSHMWSVS